jgi:hypothetical protein
MAASNQGINQALSKGASQPGSANRGFASMDPERQRQIVNQGSKVAQESGNARELTSGQAREPIRKGGQAGGGGTQTGGSGTGSR